MFEPLYPEDAARVRHLVDIFTGIGDERMKDIGLYNHALQVEAAGFRRWENWIAGILVTPWFMNLILLPTEAGQLADAVVGTKRRLQMPCGEVVCNVGEVEEIGLYLASSLYSPMGRFDVHAVAITTAWAAVEKFFKVPEVEEPPHGDRK
jgi:[NiFe] hydrogenase assembly HybE family chaperone